MIGHRQPFSSVPERTLGEQDISSYGISSVGELLNEVTRENGDTADQPLVLVNGKPVGSHDDIANYPVEALSQVQVLPPGSATKFGRSPEQRVYNIILKKNADVRVGRASVRIATEGGWDSRTGDFSYTKINGEKRFNGALTFRNDDPLFESNRRVTEPEGSRAGLSRFRTLQPGIGSYQLSVSAADRLAPWLSGSIAGKLGSNENHSLLGLNQEGGPLSQRGRSRNANLDLALNAEFGPWLVDLSASSQFDWTRTRTQGVLQGNPASAAGFDTTAATSNASSTLTATGPLVSLPAGRLQLTLASAISRDAISGGEARTRSRFVKLQEDLSAGFDIPLASRTNHFLPGLGELMATLQLRRSHVSHFGWLNSQTVALTWQPSRWLRLFGSVTRGQTPPDIELLGGAFLETPGVIYFDPSRNETVSVTEISGGNADLSAERLAGRRLSANLKPSRKLPLELTIEYSSDHNRGVITALPPASALIFAAFPERFVRDPNGVLTTVDIRPIQFAKEDDEQLRYGINLTLALGHAKSSASTSTHESRSPLASKGSATTSDIPAPARPRLQFNLSYTQLLKNRLQMAADSSPIDLLSRSAIGLGGVGRPRHQLDLSLGYAETGLGVRLTGQYRSATYLNLGQGSQVDTLRFSPLATFTLKSWVEPSRFSGAKWLRNTRLTLSIVNIGNVRQSIRDVSGATPLAYQGVYRDPIGRTIEIELRKQF